MTDGISMHNLPFCDVFKGEKVLITGHTGFKGSWLTIWLSLLGADVIGYSLSPPTDPSLFIECDLEKNITHIVGDIRDYNHVEKIFRLHKPTFVFHLAAQALVRESYLSPKSTFDTNIGGTVNLLESVRKSDSVKAFINVTSDKCYDNREWVWGYRENDPMGGNDPYSASKGCAELVFSSYYKSFFAKTSKGLASVRAGNVIGGGDWAQDRLIPDCVKSLILSQKIKIRNPGSIRPWQHVLEPLSGYILLCSLLFENPAKYSGPWNFGPNMYSTLRVDDVVDSFVAMWGEGGWLNDSKNDEMGKESKSLALCCDKANSYLSWQPALSLDETLKLTADWYKAYYSDNNMHKKSIEQLNFYINKAREKKIRWAIEG